MLSARGVRNACPRCNFSSSLSYSRFSHNPTPLTRSRTAFQGQLTQSNRRTAITQSFSTSRILRQEAAAAAQHNSPSEIEKVVRDAKQRFRDTLPKGYLTAEEYALYERWYGPPLRETAPEDVGIDTHADMSPQPPRPDNEGVLLRELEGGEFEEVSYQIPRQEGAEEEMVEEVEAETTVDVANRMPDYVDLVARSKREHDAMKKLARDYEETQKKQREHDDLVEESEAQAETGEEVAPYWPPEEETWYPEREGPAELRRFHPWSLEGRFHGSPVEIALPHDELVMPIRELLERTHIDHVKAAAETAFGGRGLPTSPSTPEGLRNGRMRGVGLPADKKHMTEIEGDAFIAGFLPPAYASVVATLREVRKRMGSDWIQSRLKEGGSGLSVLDAGSGGAGLVAWDQILRAEWDLLKEKGEVEGSEPPGKRTVVIGSDRLRSRVKNFLHNTTFLPRLPDYAHSGETRSGKHLDAGDKPQTRKSYDIIIASHLFLQEEQDHYRQAILNNLWSLLNKDGGILVVLEKAHPRGFEAVAHVRETILKQFLLPQAGEPDLTPEEFNPAYHREREQGHIVAPCTNHGTCPMYQIPGKSAGRKDFCHFSQRFVRPMFYSRMLGSKLNNQGEVEFSYVAFQRGVPKTSQMTGKEATDEAFNGYANAETKPDMQKLPRLMLPALKRKGHVTLDVCTAEGKLERWTVPKSYSKLAYHDARKSRWGDLWALGAKSRVERSARVGRGVEDGGKRSNEQKKKKPRKIDVVVGPDGMTATQRNAPQERRSKSKKGKENDLLKELMEAEKEEARLFEKELKAEAQAEIEDDARRALR